jgi:hypothetical protein
MDQDSVKLGLLMETAERHQKLAEGAIGKLNEQAQGLEAVVRDQIRRAVAEKLKIVQAETQKGGRGPAEGEAGRQCARDPLDDWSYCDIGGHRALRRLVRPA